MLMSGNDNHVAGLGNMNEALTPNQVGQSGYEGYLNDRVVSVAALLNSAGYHTYMAGKWHLGTTPESNPYQKGFEHSFVLIEGAGNHYNDQGVFENAEISPYTEDGKPAEWKDGQYSTDFYTDKLIEYIDRHKDDKQPFFVFCITP